MALELGTHPKLTQIADALVHIRVGAMASCAVWWHLGRAFEALLNPKNLGR